MLKKATPSLPASDDEANAYIARYGDVQREIKRLEDRLATRVAKLRQATDARVKPLREEEKNIEQSLKAYATKHYKRLFKEKKHSKFSAGTIGWRKGRVQLLFTVSREILARQFRRLANGWKYFSIEIKIHEAPLIKDQPKVKGIVYLPPKNNFYIKTDPQIEATRTTVKEQASVPQ